jgi:hypothetical protein
MCRKKYFVAAMKPAGSIQHSFNPAEFVYRHDTLTLSRPNGVRAKIVEECISEKISGNVRRVLLVRKAL